MKDLAGFLRAHGLEQYEQLFTKNDVDLATLRLLSERDLEELGLLFGARKRLMAALKQDAKPEVQSGDVEQRRQITVLFCDIVGYTKLSTQYDPEILTGVVRGYEDLCAACVARYDGYLFQRLGDGIVAFFGYPLAHEREAERAIRAGHAILEGVKNLAHPLDVRIGITTGVVAISSGGRMVIGDAMNLAARLQAAAEPGTMAVSSTVRRLAGDAFRYEPLGEIEFRGFPRPISTFRVDGAGAMPADKAVLEDVVPVGRDDELGHLAALWHKVRTEGHGQVIGITGEPGIGKSRIAATVCARIMTSEHRLIRCHCSPFHSATPFYPVIAHLEAAMAFDDNPSPEKRLELIEDLVCGHCRLPAAEVRFIAALMSVPFAHRFGEISEAPRAVRADTLRILMAILASASSAAPAVLLFEDLHWADATTCELIDLLVAQIRQTPVLVVTTYRPEFDPGWAAASHCTLLSLSRLSQEQSRAMILRCTNGKSLPPAIEDAIAAKTDGVPLFIEEMIRSLIDSGQLVIAGDRYVQADGILSISLPDTLRGSLTARLDRLVKAKRVAQVGAVIGRSFSRDLISELIPEPEQVNDGLRELVEAHLAFESEPGSQKVYVFKHALVQDAAYESLLLSQRKDLHGRVVELLARKDPGLADRQPELLAHHLTAAGADANAVPMWLKAADMAMQRFSVSEAVSHLRKGLSRLAVIPPDRERDKLELRYRAALGPALVAERGWGHPELRSVLEPAWSLATSLDDRNSYLPILNALWVHTMCTDQLFLSLNWADRMLRLSEETESGDLRVVAHRALSGSYYWRGDLRRANYHGDLLQTTYDPHKHWHVAERTNTDPLTGEAIYRGQYLWMLGYPNQAVVASNTRDAHARRRGHPFDLAFSLTLGAQVFDFLGMPDELESRADEATALGRRFGVSLFFEIMAEISRGVAWLRAGDHAEAAEQIERGVARLASTGHRIWLAYLRALRGEALALLGETEAAGRVMDESIASIERGEERCHFAEVLRLRGWLAGLEGEDASAEALFRRSLEVARGQEAKSWELRSATSLAELMARKGARTEAYAILAPVYGWFREGFDTRDLKSAAALLGRLGDRPPHAVAGTSPPTGSTLI